MTTSPAAGAGTADDEIAARISNALIVKNINVRALSDETGISYPTLRRSLKGGRSLTFLEFTKIAEVIGVPAATLLPDALTKDAAFPKRMGRPEEYGKLVVAIVENPMLNGGCIRLDAGQRFAPK